MLGGANNYVIFQDGGGGRFQGCLIGFTSCSWKENQKRSFMVRCKWQVSIHSTRGKDTCAVALLTEPLQREELRNLLALPSLLGGQLKKKKSRWWLQVQSCRREGLFPRRQRDTRAWNVWWARKQGQTLPSNSQSVSVIIAEIALVYL